MKIGLRGLNLVFVDIMKFCIGWLKNNRRKISRKERNQKGTNSISINH